VATVTAYLGLCGSGKSELARREHQASGAVVIDESLYAKLDHLYAALRSGKNCVITEIDLCLPARRQALECLLHENSPGTNIIWRPIENDLDKANQNCRRPERKLEKPDYDAEAHVRMNIDWFQCYEYPEGVPVLAMWPYDEPITGEKSATQS
jgi:hypothetical protein